MEPKEQILCMYGVWGGYPANKVRLGMQLSRCMIPIFLEPRYGDANKRMQTTAVWTQNVTNSGDSTEGDDKHFLRKPVLQLRLQGGKGG